MLFPTAEFVIFFLLAFAGGWLLCPGRTSWRLFMLAASYVFYAFFDVRFAVGAAAVTLVGWLLLLGVGRGRRSWLGGVLATLSIAAHLGLLAYFKYAGFFVGTVVTALGAVGVHLPWGVGEIVLPVGLSFLAFRGIAAAVDVYRGDADVPGVLDYAVFTMFFPYVAAGPVVRLGEIVPQLQERRDPRNVMAAQAFLLIAGGLAKKMLVADYLARTIVDGVFTTPALYSPVETLAGILGYSVQIYCDFSGYTDMAIGIALLLGIKLPQNFAQPYSAASLQRFWRKWHITLSNFLRDYLYIPLGGNRKGHARTYVNLVVTMVLGGLWHGAGWTFVIWGLLHGLGQAAERLYKEYRGPDARPMFAPLAWLLTFGFVTFAWVFFRADSVSGAFAVLGRLFAFGSLGTVRVPWPVWALIALTIGVQFVPEDWRERARATFGRIQPAWQGLALAAVIFVVSVLGPEGPAAFIYSGF